MARPFSYLIRKRQNDVAGATYDALRLLGIALFGYLAAVATAVSVTGAIIFVPMLYYGKYNELVIIFSIASFATAILAFPVFIAVVIVAEKYKWRRWIGFALAGALDALLCTLFFVVNTNGDTRSIAWMMLAPCVAGGLAGGYVYWRVGDRRLLRPITRLPILAGQGE